MPVNNYTIQQLMGQGLTYEQAYAQEKERSDQAGLKKTGEVASTWMNKFFDEWDTSRQKTEGMFNQALQSVKSTENQINTKINTSIANFNQGIGKAQSFLDQAKGKLGGIDDLMDQVESDYQEFKTQYDPLEKESIETASQGLKTQRELMSTLSGLNKADYEGVAGSAKADVASESERARQAEARRLSSLGIDPSAGMGAGTMRKSRMDEAINKVLAGNLARTTEKARLQDLVGMGLSTVKPGEAFGIGQGIRGISQGYLGQKGGIEELGIRSRENLTKAATDIASAQGSGLASLEGIRTSGLTNLSGQSGDLATSYANTQTQPVGEMGSAFLGLTIGTNPNAAKPSGTLLEEAA